MMNNASFFLRSWRRMLVAFCLLSGSFLFFPLRLWGEDLPEVLARGELRHLGLPYANFVSGAGDGFSVDLVKGFADSLGLQYRFVPTSWAEILPDLLGREVRVEGSRIFLGGSIPFRGDMIAMGFTVLPWREELLTFSEPTFISQVWLLTRSDSPVVPIVPSGNLEEDIRRTKAKMKNLTVLGMANTCLDPALYSLEECGARPRYFEGNLNELAPAVFKGDADSTILDVPDSMVALQKWPGEIKVIGPVSPHQFMAAAFRKDSPELLRAFNDYLRRIRNTGEYLELVKRYYPGALLYFPEFFSRP